MLQARMTQIDGSAPMELWELRADTATFSRDGGGQRKITEPMSEGEPFKNKYKFERQVCSFILQICIEYLPDTLSCTRDSVSEQSRQIALFGGTEKKHLNECSLDWKKKKI